jgi:hypothetical protein
VLIGLAGIGLLIPIQRHFFMITLLSNITWGFLALVLILWEWRRRPPKVTEIGNQQDRK